VIIPSFIGSIGGIKIVLASEGFRHMLKLSGRPFRIRYYTETIGSVWDDDRTVALSGASVYVSGVIQKIDQTRGSSDQVLVEEGRINFEDSVIFIAGSVDTTSGVKPFTIAVSGVDQVFRPITPGTNQPQFFGDDVLQKLYVRELPGGSLF